MKQNLLITRHSFILSIISFRITPDDFTRQEQTFLLPGTSGLVVLDLVGGTEPRTFHPCIHRTLRNWKNKIGNHK